MPVDPADRVLIVGSGLAGLVTALSLAPLPVLVASEGTLGDSGCSALAQGGIAAALGAGDSVDCHAADTVAVGGGLTVPAVAADILADAPAGITRLIRWGVAFDGGLDGRPDLTLEAAHSRRRILHAGGDRTGAALMQALTARVRAARWIDVMERTRVADLSVTDGRVVGATMHRAGESVCIPARAVVLATGGLGALYAATTNPAGNWGSGLLLAARAGAVLRDLEFVQFHPTALAAADETGGAALPLVSEAVRGEGAVLVDDRGDPVTAGIDGGDLAPRDTVARAIWQRLQSGRRVFLDASGALGPCFPDRFPTITASCRARGIDPVRDPIPVRPAAHYHMGGVRTDLDGRTRVSGLWAVGEAASTGLHGANRLASNSLIEAVVMAGRAAEDIRGMSRPKIAVPRQDVRALPCEIGTDDAVVMARIRNRMDRDVGVVRDRTGLQTAIQWLSNVCDGRSETSVVWRMASVARMVAEAALTRAESRGAHVRRDFPISDARWCRHQDIGRVGTGGTADRAQGPQGRERIS